ncbi:hypothetical protein SAMN05421827_10774 [Pedobacter terrae]|uniref:Uncharacterized protein n=1 Tax=Pedobacter terrae TaxID=405671 RepID=A0A1G7UQ52_9SPHI|nr:hypothetical protein SAMN05421827_10774 [Pedobacter terrae]
MSCQRDRFINLSCSHHPDPIVIGFTSGSVTEKMLINKLKDRILLALKQFINKNLKNDHRIN